MKEREREKKERERDGQRKKEREKERERNGTLMQPSQSTISCILAPWAVQKLRQHPYFRAADDG